MPQGSQWSDVYIRDTFTDLGSVPVNDANVSTSPDIIPYGTQTLTQQQLIDTYAGPPVASEIVAANLNNVYVRGRNLYSGATGAAIRLYWAPGNLLVQPSAWAANLVPNTNGFDYASLSAQSPDQIMPGDQPFNFTPTLEMGTHFCFVAMVETSRNPNPVPAQNFTGWDAFVSWVRDNANVAWRNVDVVTKLPTQGYESKLEFENPNETDQMYAFTCTWTGMPIGSIIRMWALADQPNQFFGFDTGAITINQANSSTKVGTIFPAGYATTIFTECQFPGSPTTPPPGVTIQTASSAWVASGSAEHEQFADLAISAAEFGANESVGLTAEGYFVPITSFTAVTPSI
ncbi:MAG: hypothetical protein ABI047_05095 [Jatrophihabitantaceae bacterium]